MVKTLRRAFAVCVLTLAGSASAQSGKVELVWSAPGPCPSEEVVRQRAERILNRPLTVADGEQLAVTAVVTPASETQPWSVTLETDLGQRRASRTVQAASCDELANATALFVAVLIEPSIDEPETEPAAPPAAPAAPAPAASPTVDRGPAPAERPPAPSPSHWSIAGAGGARSALVPQWTLGLGLYGAFSWKALRTSAGASVWLPTEKPVSDNQGARIQLSAAYAKLCFRFESAPLTPALCSGGELSVLRAEGFGPGVAPEARSAAIFSLSAGSELFLLKAEKLALVLAADAVFPLGDRQFVFAGSDPAVVHAPAMGFQLTCGAEWSL